MTPSTAFNISLGDSLRTFSLFWKLEYPEILTEIYKNASIQNFSLDFITFRKNRILPVLRDLKLIRTLWKS